MSSVPVEQTGADGVVAARRRRLVAVLTGVGLLGVVGGVGVPIGWPYWFPKRFAAVEPGHVYRSGLLKAGPLERVIEQHQLKTIVSLLDPFAAGADQEKEAEVARKKGVKLVSVGMPGNGCASFDLLDQAASAMADPANQPVLVHCSAGVQRTGAAVAAWRMKYCGWTIDQVLAEAGQHELTTSSNPKLVQHLRRYYETRVTGSRSASAPATEPTR